MAEEAKKDEVTQQEQKPQGAAASTGDGASDEGDSKLSMTQAELDALVEKRLARERRKWEKAGAAKPAPAAAAGEQPAAAGAEGAGAAADNSAALAAKDQEIRELHAQFAAMKAGVKPDMVEDAVYLAIKAAEKDGEEADEDDIADALKDVLKRHPEWKSGSTEDGKKKGGFKVGADGAAAGTAADTTKALPTGRVIF